jgi:WD40 repeat protein
MNKTKIAFITSFLVIAGFILILSFYFTRAKNKKLNYLYQLGEKVSRSIDEEPENAAVEIRFDNDNIKIITLLNNGRIELWDLDEKTMTLITETDKLFSYCAKKDLLITMKNNEIYLIDIISGYKKLLTNGEYILASVDENCKTAALSTGTKEIEIWDLKSSILKSKIRTTLPVRNGLALSADGQKVAAAEGIYHEGKNKHETIIEIWDLASENQEPILKYDKRQSGLIVGVWNILFTSLNNNIVFDTQSFAESGIILLDLEGSTIFEKTGFSSYWMRAADFHADKNYLATGDEEKNMVVWDINSKGIGFYNKMAEVVESVSFSNDGSMLAAGIADSTIQLFSTDREK